jgi:hypothetical protein
MRVVLTISDRIILVGATDSFVPYRQQSNYDHYEAATAAPG